MAEPRIHTASVDLVREPRIVLHMADPIGMPNVGLRMEYRGTFMGPRYTPSCIAGLVPGPVDYRPHPVELVARQEIDQAEHKRIMDLMMKGEYVDAGEILREAFNALPDVEELTFYWKGTAFEEEREYWDKEWISDDEYHAKHRVNIVRGYDITAKSNWGRDYSERFYGSDWFLFLEKRGVTRSDLGAVRVALDELFLGPREGRPTKYWSAR